MRRYVYNKNAFHLLANLSIFFEFTKGEHKIDKEKGTEFCHFSYFRSDSLYKKNTGFNLFLRLWSVVIKHFKCLPQNLIFIFKK